MVVVWLCVLMDRCRWVGVGEWGVASGPAGEEVVGTARAWLVNHRCWCV